MLSYTLPLNNRTDRHLRLTADEAAELYGKGFRFSIFDPGRGECHLSLPYETVINLTYETLTIRQPES